MKLLVLIIASSFSFCTTTKPAKTIHTKTATASKKGKTALVDANWMEKYKASETKYGYHIEQDAQIKSSGGKYRVPQEVIDHNLDMNKTP